MYNSNIEPSTSPSPIYNPWVMWICCFWVIKFPTYIDGCHKIGLFCMINMPTNLNHRTILLLKKIIFPGIIEVPLPHRVKDIGTTLSIKIFQLKVICWFCHTEIDVPCWNSWSHGRLDSQLPNNIELRVCLRRNIESSIWLTHYDVV